MGYKVIESGKLSVDEKIKKATLVKPTPTEDKAKEQKDGEPNDAPQANAEEKK